MNPCRPNDLWLNYLQKIGHKRKCDEGHNLWVLWRGLVGLQWKDTPVVGDGFLKMARLAS
jgi:hypothetical protein